MHHFTIARKSLDPVLVLGDYALQQRMRANRIQYSAARWNNWLHARAVDL